MKDPEDLFKEFDIEFDSKYKEIFKSLNHPYLFVGVSPGEECHRVFVAGDLSEAKMPDIIMMKHALSRAFDSLLADKVTSEATGYKRKNSEDRTLSSEDDSADDRVIMLTSGIALVYRVLLKLPKAVNEEHKQFMLDSIRDVVDDLERLANQMELPDVIDMKLTLLVDGLREKTMTDDYLAGLVTLAKELVDHYMEETS